MLYTFALQAQASLFLTWCFLHVHCAVYTALLTSFYSSFTDGYVLSNRLHEHMEWKAANYYDPKNSRYLICFIDNLNMAKVEISDLQ